ncbi:hypothetical protein ACFC1T_09330 [Kitasatospora sp. NPDC056076]|uniref:hypothetical protein n=1 Tax=Kitasatospora sp. NPDC056076 TaxID=3345703 RepID=UPI0035D62503
MGVPDRSGDTRKLINPGMTEAQIARADDETCTRLRQEADDPQMSFNRAKAALMDAFEGWIEEITGVDGEKAVSVGGLADELLEAASAVSAAVRASKDTNFADAWGPAVSCLSKAASHVSLASTAKKGTELRRLQMCAATTWTQRAETVAQAAAKAGFVITGGVPDRGPVAEGRMTMADFRILPKSPYMPRYRI